MSRARRSCGTCAIFSTCSTIGLSLNAKTFTLAVVIFHKHEPYVNGGKLKVLEYCVPAVSSRCATFTLYPLGDLHIGAMNCAEKQIRSVVKEIKDDPYALWFGGGDVLDSIILQDSKRFDPSVLPSWLLSGQPDEVRMQLSDMVTAERDRFLNIVEPIKDKCVGLMEGNHEYAIMKYHNRDLMRDMCKALGVKHLTDCCFVRFKFTRTKRHSHPETTTVRMFATHGCGGGRRPGSEPTHLHALCSDKTCELVLRGHSHIQHILPPVARLTIPTSGSLSDEAESTVMRAANWGCYLRTYAAGPSTYDSRAQYPVRPLSTVRVRITPFRQIRDRTRPKVVIEELEMMH